MSIFYNYDDTKNIFSFYPWIYYYILIKYFHGHKKYIDRFPRVWFWFVYMSKLTICLVITGKRVCCNLSTLYSIGRNKK